MKCHRPVAGYQDFWQNYPGAITFGLCTSTEVWRVWTAATDGGTTWESGGRQLHIQTPSSHRVTSLKILLKQKTNQKTTSQRIWGESSRVLVQTRNMPRTILGTWNPVVDYCWLCNLSRGNSSTKSSYTCAGKVEDILPACEIRKFSVHFFTFWLCSVTIDTLCAHVPWRECCFNPVSLWGSLNKTRLSSCRNVSYA